MSQQPGVVDAAVSSTYPLNPQGITQGPANVTIQLEGRPPDDEYRLQVDPRAVSTGYFRALDIKLLRGRLFTDADDDKAPRVAIVNDAAARSLGFGGSGRKKILIRQWDHVDNGSWRCW